MFHRSQKTSPKPLPANPCMSEPAINFVLIWRSLETDSLALPFAKIPLVVSDE